MILQLFVNIGKIDDATSGTVIAQLEKKEMPRILTGAKSMLALDNGGNSALSHRHLTLVVTELTKLFFEGIDPSCQESASADPCGVDWKSQKGLAGGISVLDLFGDPDSAPCKRETSEFGKSAVLNVYHRNDPHNNLRWFVRSLSHAVNNMLMGILGNITLIGMDCRKTNGVVFQIRRIERLITSAANLTHLLFGYLSERRLPAKKLQLAQLLAAIDNTVRTNEGRKVFYGIRSCMQTISPVHDRFTVAASMAGVIEQLLVWIKTQWTHMDLTHIKRKPVACRCRTIDELIEKGFLMVKQLRFYSGQQKVSVKRMSLRVLLQKQIRRI